MSGRKIVCVGVAILVLVTGRVQAQHGGMHHASWHGWHGGGGRQRGLAAAILGWLYGGLLRRVLRRVCSHAGDRARGVSCPRSDGWALPSCRGGDRSCRHPRRA